MITSTQPVCVVIPVYTTELSRSEQTSLDRCVAVLGQHPIVLAKPESLSPKFFVDRHPSLSHQSFPDKFFAGIDGYNCMMLSEEFYASFAEFEHMLIHQLDAFVFSDQLLKWCRSGYDYIGAPWLADRNPTFSQELLLAIRRRYYRLLNIQDKSKGHTIDPQLRFSAGNGGLSLRRIASIRSILSRLSRRIEPHLTGPTWYRAEDVFFSVKANRYRSNLRIPSAAVAAKFSWESCPTLAAQLTNGQLPFGCHAWNKLHREDWRPIFARLGYSIDELLDPEDIASDTTIHESESITQVQ